MDAELRRPGACGLVTFSPQPLASYYALERAVQFQRFRRVGAAGLPSESIDKISAHGRIRAAWEGYLHAWDSSPAPVGPLFLIDACRITGTADQGLAMTARIWMDTGSTELRWCDAELQRLEGELILLQNKRDACTEAAARFQRAVEIACEQGARLYELRAAISQARLCRSRRSEDEARATLQRVYAEFTEGLDTPTSARQRTAWAVDR